MSTNMVSFSKIDPTSLSEDDNNEQQPALNETAIEILRSIQHPILPRLLGDNAVTTLAKYVTRFWIGLNLLEGQDFEHDLLEIDQSDRDRLNAIINNKNESEGVRWLVKELASVVASGKAVCEKYVEGQKKVEVLQRQIESGRETMYECFLVIRNQWKLSLIHI